MSSSPTTAGPTISGPTISVPTISEPRRFAPIGPTRRSVLSRGLLTIGLAGAATLPLTACTKDDAQQSAAETPAQVLAKVKQVVDAAASIHLTLTSDGIPDATDGVRSAEGVGTHAPAFKGTFQLRLKGVAASAEVVAVDGVVYAKLPFVPGYAQVSPAALGAPDPAVLFSADRGITTLLAKTTKLTVGNETRVGSETVTTYKGELTGQDVYDLLQLGDRPSVFDVVYGVTSTNELRTVQLVGPFYPGSTSTYSLTLDRYGAAVSITKP